MKNLISPDSQRRKFVKQTMAFLLTAPLLPSVVGQFVPASFSNHLPTDKKPPLEPELVAEFVRVAHFDLSKVKEMLDKEPMLVNACWDWGGGDFETALGGPSHIGNRDIANYLLEHGARKDIFCSAMLGDRDLVKSFIKNNPGIADVDGPHHLTLLYHVAISGDIKMAEIVKPHVSVMADFNQALQAAAKNGRAEMTEWLLKHGCDDPNTTDFAGNTSLQNAEKKGFKEIADILKKYGAK